LLNTPCQTSEAKTKEQNRQHIQYLKRKYKAELEKLKEINPEVKAFHLRQLELTEDMKRDRRKIREHQNFLKFTFKKRLDRKQVFSSI
jgi:hypothetical protein